VYVNSIYSDENVFLLKYGTIVIIVISENKHD